MLTLKFRVETIDSQLKLIKLKEDIPGKSSFSPTEVKTITLALVTVDPEEWEFFKLGEEYFVAIEKIAEDAA